jgi:hypothetical protein
MKRMMKVMLALIFAATIASSASALDTLYFTTSQTDGTPPASQIFSFNPNSNNQVLYLWASNGTSVTPDQSSTATGWPVSLPTSTAYFSYDLGLSATTNVNLASASINNPNILTGSGAGTTFTADTDWDGGLTTPGHPTGPATVTRWNSASTFTVGLNAQATTSAITQLNAVTLPTPLSGNGTSSAPTGVNTAVKNGVVGTGSVPNTGYTGPGPQPGYDSAGRILIGTVTFNTLAAGTGTTLQVKTSTLNTSASSAIGKSNSTGAAAPYTATYTDLSTSYTQASGVFATATINVANNVRNGDFTGPTPGQPDGVINGLDIDWLFKDLRNSTTTPNEDVNMDSVINGYPVVSTTTHTDANHEVGSLVDTGLGVGTGTHYGDANLDGTVTGADVGLMILHWQQNGAGWAGGDVNGDGVVTGADVGLAILNWQLSGGTGALSTVPEPASIALFGIGAFALVACYRKRHNK